MLRRSLHTGGKGNALSGQPDQQAYDFTAPWATHELPALEFGRTTYAFTHEKGAPHTRFPEEIPESRRHL